eukprot:856614-Pelagomonas_calceolata.AAC.1
MKGQAASADQDSQARACKIAQAIKATWGPSRNYRTFGGYAGPSSYRNGSPIFWFPPGSLIPGCIGDYPLQFSIEMHAWQWMLRTE